MVGKRLFFILILVAAAVTGLRAQPAASGSTISFQPVYGAHMITDDRVKDRFYGADITWLRDVHTREDGWVKQSGASAWGFTFVYRDMNRFNGFGDTSANSFGQSYGIAATVQFRLLKLKKVNVLLSPGIGISYVTKTFFTNPYNRFIGSHLNLTLKSDLGIEVPLTSSLRMIAGAGFGHLSNGGFQLPNGGINMIGAYAGVRLGGVSDDPKPGKEKYQSLKHNSWELSLGMGRRGVYEERSGNYRSGLYAGYNFRLNDLVTIKAGADAVYYFTRFNPSRYWETYQNYGTSYSPWRLGTSIGTDINLWRVVIGVQAGKYLYFERLNKNITWYWTLAPTYFVTPNIGLQVKGYFHLDQADFLNYGLVFRI